MSSTIVEEKLNLMNKLAKALAKDESITEVQALAKIKNQFMDRQETTETLRGISMPRLGGGNGTMAPQVPAEDAYGVYTEMAKVEMRKLELEQKRLDTEQKKADIEARKLELAEKKIESEEKLAREKMDREDKRAAEKQDREDKRAADQLTLERERERAREDRATQEVNWNKQLLLANMGGKQKDEFYSSLLESKDKEKDRDNAFKIELAKIEAERDKEINQLKGETDSLTATKIDELTSIMRSQFDKEQDNIKGSDSVEDAMDKMDKYEKQQERVVDSWMKRMERMGLDMTTLRKATGIEEKRQESTLGKIVNALVPVWEVVQPRIDAALHPGAGTEASGPENSQQIQERQRQAAEQQRVAREREDKMRKDVEIEASRLTAENERLEREKEQLKQREETNKELQQRYYEQRRILTEKAAELGILITDQMNNEAIFNAIEQTEAALERQHQAHAVHAREQEQAAVEAEQKQAELGQQAKVAQAEEPAEKIEEVHEVLKQEPLDVIHIEADPQLQKPKETGSKQKRKKKGTTETYTVTKEDGTPVGEFQASRHNYAAQKAANTLDGTKENPIKLKVKDSQGDEKIYSTYKEEVDGPHGRKIIQPRAQAVSA